jgi:hypothetical protein
VAPRSAKAKQAAKAISSSSSRSSICLPAEAKEGPTNSNSPLSSILPPSLPSLPPTRSSFPFLLWLSHICVPCTDTLARGIPSGPRGRHGLARPPRVVLVRAARFVRVWKYVVWCCSQLANSRDLTVAWIPGPIANACPQAERKATTSPVWRQISWKATGLMRT